MLLLCFRCWGKMKTWRRHPLSFYHSPPNLEFRDQINVAIRRRIGNLKNTHVGAHLSIPWQPYSFNVWLALRYMDSSHTSDDGPNIRAPLWSFIDGSRAVVVWVLAKVLNWVNEWDTVTRFIVVLFLKLIISIGLTLSMTKFINSTCYKVVLSTMKVK